MTGRRNLFGAGPPLYCPETMADAVSTGLAVLAVALFGVALYAMTAGRFTAAGMSFLSASLVIYLRETRLQDDGAAA